MKNSWQKWAAYRHGSFYEDVQEHYISDTSFEEDEDLKEDAYQIVSKYVKGQKDLGND